MEGSAWKVDTGFARHRGRTGTNKSKSQLQTPMYSSTDPVYTKGAPGSPFHPIRADLIGRRPSLLKGGDVGQRRLGDGGERFSCKEALMGRDHDIRESEQTGEDIILNHPVGEILEEEVGLFFIDIQAEGADFARLQGGDHCPRVNERAAPGVDQHHARFHSAQRFDTDEMTGFRHEGTMKGDDVGFSKEIRKRNIIDPEGVTCLIGIRIMGEQPAPEAA